MSSSAQNQSSRMDLGSINVQSSEELVAVVQLGAAAALMWEELPLDIRRRLLSAVGRVDGVVANDQAQAHLRHVLVRHHPISMVKLD